MQLCASSKAVTTHLFGDDLAKIMKDISEANKMGHNVSRNDYTPGRYKGNSRHANKGKGAAKKFKRRRDWDENNFPKGKGKPRNF